MPHYVPHFEFTEPALALREYNYQHWCENGVDVTNWGG